MANCTKWGEYTKFDGGLCLTCYKSKNDPQITKKEPIIDQVHIGRTDKDRNYRYNMIKGRIAETLIQELFLSLGYNAVP